MKLGEIYKLYLPVCYLKCEHCNN